MAPTSPHKPATASNQVSAGFVNVLPVKADESSDLEQNGLSVRGLVACQNRSRSACLSSYKLILVVVASAGLSVQIAALGMAHWHELQKEVEHLEVENMALHANLSRASAEGATIQGQLLSVEHELRIRTAHLGDIQSEMHHLKDETALLRKNISMLKARNTVADEELVWRKEQWEAMSVKNMVLKDSNQRLMANMSAVEDKNRFLVEEMDRKYKEFVHMRKAMNNLEMDNRQLRRNLTASRINIDGLVDYAANKSMVTHQLQERNKRLRSNMEHAEVSEEVVRVRETEELSERDQHVVGLSEDLQLLRDRNAELEGAFRESQE